MNDVVQADTGTIDVLRTARSSITDRGNWSRGAMVTAGGAMCSIGAVHRSGGGAYSGPASRELSRTLRRSGHLPGFLGVPGVMMYNDTHRHKSVLSMFDRTIRRLERAILPERRVHVHPVRVAERRILVEPPLTLEPPVHAESEMALA